MQGEMTERCEQWQIKMKEIVYKGQKTRATLAVSDRR